MSQTQPKDLKIAIVSDWIISGGAERVVEELHKAYPEAPIYTSYCTDEWREKLNNKVDSFQEVERADCQQSGWTG